MSNGDNAKKLPSGWYKAEIIGKIISGLLTGLTIAFVGFYTSSYLNDRQNNELRMRLYTELISNREGAESALRKDMFTSIINTFMGPASTSIESKLLDLELLTYNFHESICMKPLYLHLAKIITGDTLIDDAARADYRKRLYKAAREITAKQALALKGVGKSFERTVYLDSLPVLLDTCTLEMESITRTFEIQVLEINKETVEMEIEVLVFGNGEPYFNGFGVGPFDFPMIDNSRLSNDQRFSVVLDKFDETTATISLVYFPGSHSSLKEKPYYQDVINRLLNIKEDEIS